MSGGGMVYRPADDPRPSRLSRLAINPFFILLLTMIFYIYLGPLWLVFNSFAMGSPRALRELLIAIASVFLFFLLLGGYIFFGAVLNDFGLTRESRSAYLGLGIKAYWIAVCYYLFMSQMKVYPIFQYYRQRAAGQRVGG